MREPEDTADQIYRMSPADLEARRLERYRSFVLEAPPELGEVREQVWRAREVYVRTFIAFLVAKEKGDQQEIARTGAEVEALLEKLVQLSGEALEITRHLDVRQLPTAVRADAYELLCERDRCLEAEERSHMKLAGRSRGVAGSSFYLSRRLDNANSRGDEAAIQQLSEALEEARQREAAVAQATREFECKLSQIRDQYEHKLSLLINSRSKTKARSRSSEPSAGG